MFIDIQKSKIRQKIIIIIIVLMCFYSIFSLFQESQAYSINYTQTVKSGIDAFPESYKTYLRAIQEQHPKWTFDAYYTGISWSDLVTYETDHGHNRVINTADPLWKCSCGNVESGYACASSGIIKYYMDPRNFLDSDKKMFQFLESSYNNNYKVEVVQSIIKNSFMKGNVTFNKDGKNVTMSYAEIIMDAASKSQMSPYAIAIKILQEVGTSGSNAVTGTYTFTYIDGKQYSGYYNFFNYGAYDTGSAVTNGLCYAKDRGWDTPYKAIVEGAEKYGADYNAKGQNTIYFTKWDVVGTKILKPGQTQTVIASNTSSNQLFRHQYMTNIQDPNSQSSRLYNTYSDNDILEETLNFVIPVYNDMPDSNKLPSTLDDLEGDLYYTTGTDIMVRKEPKVSGARVDCIAKRDTIVTVLERKTAHNDGLDWDKVKLANGKVGYMASKYLEPCGNSNTNTDGKKAQIINNNTIKAIANINGKTLVNELKITNYEIVRDGNKKSDTDLVGTGDILKDKSNNKEYVISVLGDMNGDGKVTPADSTVVLRSYVGLSQTVDCIKLAGDVNGDGKITPADSTIILRAYVGLTHINI